MIERPQQPKRQLYPTIGDDLPDFRAMMMTAQAPEPVLRVSSSVPGHKDHVLHSTNSIRKPEFRFDSGNDKLLDLAAEEQLDVTSMNFVDERRPLDVLCGRGSRSNMNKGNQLFLQAKNEMQQRYKQASRKEKIEMSRELISKVESWGGRFIHLYSDPNNCDGPERWYEVSPQVKLRRASQALRETSTPQARKEKREKYNKKKNGI